MKTVTIQSLRLKNFKGITDFTIDPAGQNINIFGENATGKTTLQDGFFYLLFGKDSQDKADFQLKPVDDAGQEIHNLETEVEAVLDVDGKTITLMKRYYEKWTKKHGSARAEFTGNTVDCFIDDVPVKKKDYDTRIGETIDLNAFKLVTNPHEFANLHWTGRRQLLLEACGNVSDQEVITSDEDLSRLADILGDCSITDYKIKVKAQQKKINDELKTIPVRIAENHEAIKDVEPPDQKEKTRLDKAMDKARDELQALKSNEALSGKRRRLNDINSEIIMAQSAADKKVRESKGPIQDEIDKLQAERRENTGKIADLKAQIDQDEKRNKTSIAAKEKLYERWYEEDAKQPKGDDICPTCGQDLPKDQVKETIATFNRLKADRLEKINAEGRVLAKNIEDREKAITAAKLSIDTLEKAVIAIDNDIKAKQAELDSVYVPVNVDDLDKEKDILESEIDALENGSKVQETNAQRHVDETQAALDEWNKTKAAWDAAQKARDRISDLEKKEKDLAAEYGRLEQELFLIEKFIVRKVELLEDQINSRFKIARFKMFKEQVNGGIEECCEILCNGVPFDRGLNNAARINTGLDIINTLSNYFGFSAPVFVDNRESVNELIPINSQLISLHVSKDKKLTVKANEEVKAA